VEKPNRHVMQLCIIFLVVAVIPRAFAVPFTYTMTGYVQAHGGGTGPTPSTVAFSWTVNADTSAMTNPSAGLYQIPAITNTITFVGVKSTGIINVTVYLNTNTGTITFGNIPGGGVGFSNSALKTWNFTSPIGPLDGPNVLTAGTITETSGFGVTLSGVANTNNGPGPTFQAAFAVPSIGSVANAASNNSPGLPNAPIAQGAIFVLYGTDVGPANISFASPAFQTSSVDGTSVAVTMKGTSVNVPLYYTSAGQVAGLLPSDTPTGTGTITVTYGGQTSSKAPITVVENNLGIFTIDSSGRGPGIVTYADYSLVSDDKAANCGGPNTTCGAANPGDTLILWATGLGPVSGNDVSGAGLGVNMPNIPLKLWLGGVQATVTYQGRSGCCVGEDQIVFTVPDNVPTGCAVPLLVQINDEVSNGVLMPVANGTRDCTPANPAFASEKLAEIALAGKLGGYGSITLNAGGTGNPDTAQISFGEILSYDPGTQPFSVTFFDDLAPGTCGVYNNLLSTTSPPMTFGNADAGSSFTIAGPNGSLTEPAGSSQLSANGTFLVPGAFTISGTGGANIGKFTADLTIPSFPTLTSPSNLSSITRSSGFTVAWAGGGAGANVQIQLFGTPGNTGLTGSQIVCEVPSSAGKFTIPAYVLAALPAGNVGYFAFTPYAPEVPFTATGLIDGQIQTDGPGASFGPFTLK
jgi:uncharacterized protein (TIGR03437 family)